MMRFSRAPSIVTSARRKPLVDAYGDTCCDGRWALGTYDVEADITDVSTKACLALLIVYERLVRHPKRR